MHGLSDADRGFLASRRRMVSYWNGIAAVLLVALVALLAWLGLKAPWMVNPIHVAHALERGGVDRDVLEMSALLLPLAVLFMILLVAVLIVFGFAIVRNERCYLAIIEQLQREQ